MLALLEWHNSKFRCPNCGNQKDGEHHPRCEYYAILQELRVKEREGT